MLDDDQKNTLLLLAVEQRSRRERGTAARESLLARHPELAEDLGYYFSTARFPSRCGCCWSGSGEEMALMFARMTDAVDEFPEDRFAVVAFAVLDGLESGEVAEQLGVPLAKALRLGRAA